MKNIPPESRGAQFRCVVAIISNNIEEITEGIIRGKINEKLRGTQGFGYDPLFLIPELGRTMAEITMEEKNHISHRARAIHAAFPLLTKLIATES